MDYLHYKLPETITEKHAYRIKFYIILFWVHVSKQTSNFLSFLT